MLCFGRRRQSSHPDIGREIQHLIDAGEQEGVISEDEGEMIQSILSFRDTTAREIMIPRTEAVAASSDISIGNLLQLVIKEGHSRIPVYSGSVDNIIGILHVKDLLASWGRDQVDLKGLLRTPHFVPETKKISQLLKELRDRKSHMAIVIDEYGGFAGLVSIEDIIEEIVGEIRDEYDTEEAQITEVGPKEFLVSGGAKVEEIEDTLGAELSEDDFITVSGMITHKLGRLPAKGETLAFDGGLTAEIVDVDQKRIKKVRFRKE